jgi:aminoglycoside phosphotransferase family enzyme/predicted kinase
MLNIKSLLEPQNYEHPVTRLELLETHISWVILTGPYAYKIKKPVNLGFLDFSSLEKRHHYCQEELRLNRRLAPDIYLDVILIRGSQQAPHFGGSGEVVEYAVKMRQFPQAAQLDRLLQHGRLPASYLDAIAETVARFHLAIERAGDDTRYGEPDIVWQPVAENFRQIREREPPARARSQLDALQDWSQTDFARLKPVFAQRKQDGFVRECHGDLHLRNIAWFEDKPVIFDCIEFNPALRWIDVISDITFLFMDLIDRGQSALAYRLLNQYLTHTGDYAGLAVLPFYFVYRALVRAKVDRIRLSQGDVSSSERTADEAEFSGYLQLAQSFVSRPAPILMITWGLSASGKTSISSQLLEVMGAIRIRSDVERKRLLNLDFMTRTKAGIGNGIYTPEMSQRTYDCLLDQARQILHAGFTVIVDAAFLDAQQRAAFAKLAQELALPFVILQCVASASTLRQRICQRQDDASDADLTILEHQLAHLRPLTGEELVYAITIDTEQLPEPGILARRISEHVAKGTLGNG